MRKPFIYLSEPDSGAYKISPNGLLIPANYKPYPTAFDFFAGCGGFSLGFIQAGFGVVGALEIDASAAHTYMTNLGAHPIQLHYTSDKYRIILEEYFDKTFKKILKNGNKRIYNCSELVESQTIDLSDNISGSGWIKSERIHRGKHWPPVKNFFFGDIKEVSGDWILERLDMKRGELDAIIGGPPCQGFSKDNHKRSPFDPRNNLIFEFARRCVEMNPKTFVMEEVPDIIDFVTPDGIPVLDALCMIFEDGGFGRFDALRNSILATAGIGFTKKGSGFKVKDRKNLKLKKTKEGDIWKAR